MFKAINEIKYKHSMIPVRSYSYSLGRLHHDPELSVLVPYRSGYTWPQ